ncbi:MAG: DNA polymerase III subunit gamma/tau [Acidobacteria bacterium]|nr:DNA polymerase III subunit gamma/tau [Acidobacteriota bacterium]
MTAKASYLALARRYRPASFDDVIGQSAAVSTLKNAVATGRLHHAYLFSGIRGVGKTTAARLFARALNCAKGPTPDPCGECDPCREIASGLSMDVIEIDAASNRGVDDVEPLREAARYAPSRDRYKVFILDEVHMLSNAAFNSLLKILEEPPPRIVWILATTEHRKVPPTVVSRCQHFEFHRVERAEIVACLERIAARESVDVDRAGLEVIAAAAAGSVRDAVSLLDQAIAYAGPKATVDDVRAAIGAIDRRAVLEFLRLVAARDGAGLLERIAALAEGGAEFSQFTSALVSTARDTAMARFTPPGSKALSVTADEEKELRELASSFSDDGLLRVFHALLDLPFAIRNAAQPRFVLEAAALRLARLADLAPIEEVIARLQGGSAPAAGSAPRAGGPAATPSARPAQAAPGALAPPSPAPGATPEAGGFRERLLAAVQSKKMSLRTYLEMARRVALDGDVVEIAFGEKQSFSRDAIETADARATIEAAASEIAGRPVRVRTALEAPGQDEPAPEAAPARRDRLIEAAMKQPEVRMVMETFRGQIVDIQEIS